MKKSRKEFIIKAHATACSEWKTKIEEEFPKLFPKVEVKVEVEVGKWYKTFLNGRKEESTLYYITKITKGKIYGYGFNMFLNQKWKSDEYFDNTSITNSGRVLANDDEVGSMLIKEAKKRGFKEGVKTISLTDPDNSYNNGICEGDSYEYLYNKLYYCGICIFKDGKWAKIVEKTYTKEEAEEKFNIKIKG